MICYADLFYEQNPILSMSKILWSVMLPLLRDYDEQNPIRPYEIDRLSRIALNPTICWCFWVVGDYKPILTLSWFQAWKTILEQLGIFDTLIEIALF